jgi:hypothetical protein
MYFRACCPLCVSGAACSLARGDTKAPGIALLGAICPRPQLEICMSLCHHLAAITLAGLSFAAVAGPTCTDEPQSKWLTEAQMTKRFQELGYTDDVKKLHVSKGKCWEIYGHDKAGKKVEIYFHPITGAIVEANVKD